MFDVKKGMIIMACGFLAFLGELHQRARGYSFSIPQLFDVEVAHHEHLIVFFLVMTLYFMIQGARESGMLGRGKIRS